MGENPFEKDIQEFEAQDREHFPPGNAVLFTGSSSIKRWHTLETDFVGIDVINRGFGGSTLGDVVHFADRIVTPYRPRAVVLYGGSHDLHIEGLEPGGVLERFEELRYKLHAVVPYAELFFISLKPSIMKWDAIHLDREVNRLVEAYAGTTNRVSYIDIWTPMVAESSPPPERYFAPDLNHINAEGYAIWTQAIRPLIE